MMEHHVKSSESKTPDSGGKIAGPVRSERAAAKRQALVVAARHVFHEKGYADATIENIIDKVGGSRGTIYVHFSSKFSLLETVIREDAEYVASMIDEALSAAANSGCDPVTLAKRLINAMSSEQAIAVLRIIIAERHNCPSIGEIYRSIVLPAEKRFARYIDEKRIRDLPAEQDAIDPPAPIALMATVQLALLTGSLNQDDREVCLNMATERLIRMLPPPSKSAHSTRNEGQSHEPRPL